MVGYYDVFPPKNMNVSVKPIDVPDGKGGQMRKRILVVNKDITAGELIYKVKPYDVVLTLLSDYLLMWVSRKNLS